MNRQRRSGVGGVADGPVEQWLRETDGLPGERAALPRGTLPGPPPDPQGDENRDPPPVSESGAGPYRRTVDLGQDTVTPSGNRRRPAIPASHSPAPVQPEDISNNATSTTDHDFVRK